MKIRDFALEVFFGKYEFTAPYLLTQSDCEAMSVRELLQYEPGSDEKLLDCWLGYTEVPGEPELRAQVSSLFKTMSDNEVLMHCGAQEAIFDYMNVVLKKDDHVICMTPAYQSLYEVALSSGCEVSFWNQRHTPNGWSVDFDALESMIKPNTKVIVVNTPNNPTGYTFTEEEIKTLCDIADRHGTYIFSDEVYKGLDPDGVKKPWIADVYDRCISLGVMSKAYGLPGLRVGWVATHNRELLDSMTKFKHYLSICNSAPSETLASVALKHGEKILARNREIIKENLSIADKFFSRCGGLFVNNPPQSGPVAFHRMNIDSPIEEFCDILVQKAGVLLLPASIYESSEPFFRMGYGRKSFGQNLIKFEEFLLSHKYI